MAANLSPEYKAAEAAFKRAREPRERLDCLREMLRTIPKHKGTERLQGDIKTRIKHLSEELLTQRRTGARRGPSYVVRPEGAAQIALIGGPNTGKSALHGKLTGSHAEVGPYPFTTSVPLPGMLRCDDVHFQLVDLPPLCRERPLPWIPNALQPAHGAMLLVDLSEPDCVERVVELREFLSGKRVSLVSPLAAGSGVGAEREDGDPFAIELPTLLVASQADRCPTLDAELEVFQELAEARYPALAVSTTTGQGLDRIGPWWFETLGIVRVYTKVPGHPADMSQPFTLRRGDTVGDVASLVHRDVAEAFRFARLWGGGQFQGQQVGRDHPVSDGDVLELHT